MLEEVPEDPSTMLEEVGEGPDPLEDNVAFEDTQSIPESLDLDDLYDPPPQL